MNTSILSPDTADCESVTEPAANSCADLSPMAALVHENPKSKPDTADTVKDAVSNRHGEHHLQNAIERDTAIKLQGAGYMPLAANAINGAILIAALWGSAIPFNGQLAWYGLLVTSVLVRFFHLKKLAPDHNSESIRRWLNGYTIGAGFAGLCWGLTSLGLYYTSDPVEMSLIVAVIAGMTAGAASTYAGFVKAAIAFNGTALSLLASYFFVQGTFTHFTMGTLVLIYFIFLNRISRTFRQGHHQTMALHQKNEKLIGNLAEKNEELRIISDYSFAWENWFDNDGHLEWVSPAVKDITGYLAEECHAIKDFPLALVHEDDAALVQSRLSAARDGETISETEFRIISKRGNVKWCSLDSRPAYDSNGKKVGHRASVRDVSERRDMQQELVRLATTDSLTGLPNRRQFMELAEKEIGRAKRYGSSTCIAMIDIDFFKKVNDTYGHQAGDFCLKAFADLVEKRRRESDLFARIGGEEFALLLPETDGVGALTVCEHLRQHVAEITVPFEGNQIAFTVSIGLTILNDKNDSLDRTLARADGALYRAKETGRNRTELAF